MDIKKIKGFIGKGIFLGVVLAVAFGVYIVISIKDSKTSKKAMVVPKPLVNASLPATPKKKTLDILEENKQQEMKSAAASMTIEKPEAKAMKPLIAPPAIGTKIMEPLNSIKTEINGEDKTTQEKSIAIKPKRVEKIAQPSVVQPKKEVVEETSFTFIEVSSQAKDLPKSDQTSTIVGEEQTQFKAVVLGDQNIFGGELLKMRATEAFKNETINIPKNTIFKGRVTVAYDRLIIDVSTITIKEKPVKVHIQAYDPSDMIIGLSIPDPTINQQKASGSENIVGGSVTSIAQGLGVIPLGAPEAINQTVKIAQAKNNKIFIRDGQEIIFISTK